MLQPILSAMFRMQRFSQCLSPWTGEEGYTETYSPATLCLLDYVERLCGILPTPEEELWFTGLLPYPMDHGEVPAEETAYARRRPARPLLDNPLHVSRKTAINFFRLA